MFAWADAIAESKALGRAALATAAANSLRFVAASLMACACARAAVAATSATALIWTAWAVFCHAFSVVASAAARRQVRAICPRSASLAVVAAAFFAACHCAAMVLASASNCASSRTLICQWHAVMSVLVLVMAVVFSLLCLTMVARSTLDFVVDLEFLAVFEVFFDFLRLLRLLFFAIFGWFGAIT